MAQVQITDQEFFEEERLQGKPIRMTEKRFCTFCFEELNLETVVVDDYQVIRFPDHPRSDGKICRGSFTMVRAISLHPWRDYFRNLRDDIADKVWSWFA